MKWILSLLILIPVAAQALPEEEKQRTCTELSRPVLPVQRETAKNLCLEFASNECDRIERSLKESCIEGSHSDNAIKYDIQRGSDSACQAALIKRDTQKIFCEGLKKECLETSLPMGGGGAKATCKSFRDEDNKRLCTEAERQAKRIADLQITEKQKCAQLKSN